MDENQDLIEQPISEPVSQEKLIPQSQLNKIVGREKETAYLRGKREAEEAYQQKMQEIASNQPVYSGNPNVDRDAEADRMYQQVQERFNREMEQRQAEEQLARAAQSYLTKTALGPQLYPDYADVTKEFNPAEFPQLAFLLSGIDNAADVVYDLAKNPTKIANLDILAQRSPRLAQAELLKLSRSITENQQAANDAQAQQTPEPLDRLQPSRVSGSNGKQTIRDLRAQPWLRG